MTGEDGGGRRYGRDRSGRRGRPTRCSAPAGMNHLIRRSVKDRRFAPPIFGGSMLVDLGAVGLTFVFARVKSIHGGKVGQVDSIIAIDGDIGWSDALMRETIIMEIC